MIIGVLSEVLCVFFFKQKTAYEMRISDWSADVCFPIFHRGFLLGRPGHLLDLANHLTHVLGRVDRCHRVELFPTTPKPRRGAVVDFCSPSPEERWAR